MKSGKITFNNTRFKPTPRQPNNLPSVMTRERALRESVIVPKAQGLKKRLDNNVIKYEEVETHQHGKVRVYSIQYLHSPVNPAVTFENGDYIWYFNGKIHRDNGPASLRDGVLSYYKHGVLHREDGPAVIYKDGTKHWYLNGVRQDKPPTPEVQNS